MTATRASLGLIAEAGVERIEAHVRRLAGRLATGLHEIGLPVVGGAPASDLTHIVSVGTVGGGRHYTADDPEINALHHLLEGRNMVLSLQSGVLRFSVGAYNDDSDIDRVLEAATDSVSELRLFSG